MNTDYEIKIISKSKGKSIVISPTGDCRLTEDGLEGFGAAAMEVKIGSSASYDGGYALSRRYTERELELTFEVVGDTDEIRRDIISICDPSDDPVIEAYLYGIRRKIDVIPCGEPIISLPNMFSPMTVTLYFIAPQVFFSAVSEREIIFSDSVPIFTFPLNLMSGAGTVSGIYRITDTASVCAEGDAECGFVLTVTADGGTVVNPKVTMSVGGAQKYIKCTVSLSDGDSAVIDTIPGQKSLTVRGAKSYAFSSGSEFFSLPTENATLTVSADSGSEYISALLRFTPLYGGI